MDAVGRGSRLLGLSGPRVPGQPVRASPTRLCPCCLWCGPQVTRPFQLTKASHWRRFSSGCPKSQPEDQHAHGRHEGEADQGPGYPERDRRHPEGEHGSGSHPCPDSRLTRPLASSRARSRWRARSPWRCSRPSARKQVLTVSRNGTSANLPSCVSAANC